MPVSELMAVFPGCCLQLKLIMVSHGTLNMKTKGYKQGTRRDANLRDGDQDKLLQYQQTHRQSLHFLEQVRN
jgi:hypothetical protein